LGQKAKYWQQEGAMPAFGDLLYATTDEASLLLLFIPSADRVLDRVMYLIHFPLPGA
jgi:hypothetical protein